MFPKNINNKKRRDCVNFEILSERERRKYKKKSINKQVKIS